MSRRKVLFALDPGPVGRGGQAEVFKARDKRTGAIVALKKLTDRGDQDSVARMRREITVQSSIVHPNVMPVLESSHQYIWYAMPLAICSLGTMNTPLDDQTLLEAIEDSSKGLLAAHQEGYVHRDITPSNILQIEAGGQIHWVVSDWGLVRAHGQTTLARTIPGQLFGTAGFAAPELWTDAHGADERADVYGLGRVAIWCLTGNTLLPNVSVEVQGIWHDFVRATTMLDAGQRPRDMHAVLRLLAEIKKTLATSST